MINGNNQYWQNAAMNIRKDGDEWRLAKDTVKNTYTSEDNGKVVSNQELVAQTAYPTEITENNTYDTTNYNSITVNVSGGGGGAGGSDVIFYDYDGTIVQSYSAADFANLTAMPANPTHTGLTAQGWNWTLNDAKTYVVANGKLNIGQMYITSDGKTRLYYVIPKDNLTLELYLTLDEGTELDVEWGDNSEHTTWTSNDGDSSKSHEYSAGGSYTVAITVVDGGFSCNSSGSEDYTLKKVELGSGVTSIGNYAFYYCFALSSITIPNSVASISSNAFGICYALSSITISNSVASISSNAFYDCTALSSITIPNSVTSIGVGAFYNCKALSSITIPNSVASIEETTFNECYSLSSITIPNSVTSIGVGAFSSCSASSITIPNSVTSIGYQAFYYCYALTSITIPSSVTNIEGSAFYGCYALSSITFEPTNPPELDEGSDIPATCIIRVPQGTLSDYTSAEYYPDPSDYIYEEY